MEDKIDKILLDNFKDGDWQTARKQLLDLFSVSGSVLKDKAHYDALLDCCNGILDSVDAGKVPQRGIMGLKILLNR